MRIETDKIIIRNMKVCDTKSFIEMASDGTLFDIFGDCRKCFEWMGYWINETIRLYNATNPYKDYLAYAIVEKKSNKIIGAVGCSAYEDMNEIGITYFIGSQFRRQGYAAEAARIFSRYFFQYYPNVPKLIATVRTDNIASCRTVEKLGYVLYEKRMYKDINDSEEQEYNFYFLDRKMFI